jgi:HK97 family phage prohead protease
MELKTLPLDAAEFKFDEARKGFFSGYASVFGGVDSYGDTIVKGAYQSTLIDRKRPIQMRWNHFGPVIGKWTAAEEDEIGLRMEGELTLGHSVADDAYALMKHGAVNGLSIGFRMPEGGSEKAGNVRLLKRIDLVEVSIVEEPADLAARIGDVKSAIDEIESL